MDNPEFREPKGRNTMTEQNQPPAADDTEGHHYMRDDAHRDDMHRDDDVEGHGRMRDDVHRDDGDDVEGHGRRRGDDDSDDAEGHLHRT
jgi:hypothetical protein